MPALIAALAPFVPLFAWPVLTPLERTMLLLIGLVGGVTLRFAHRYLQGDADRPRFERWFVATFAAAALVVLADDLAVMVLAWTATSLSLHQLLTVRAGRAAAEVAAHKKFLLSRIADLALFGAVALLAWEFGTTRTASVLAQAAALDTLPARVEVAGLLLAAGVIMRSAQLPFHGWLIEVMEVPTPVSALLHAGVVNLGAYVLIALAPLVGRLPGAQAMLIVAGTVTAVLASLVLLTRGSVKGALAWSTCAQMGFVLLECGLGAYDLALLHLVAHALYKAHAFLRSGSAVTRHAAAAPGALRAAPGALRWVGAIALAAPLVAGIGLLTWGAAAERPATLVSASVLALAVATALAHADLRGGWRALRVPALLAIGLPLAYAGWHALFARLVPLAVAPAPSGAVLLAVVLAFVALAIVQARVTAAPAGALARALHPHAVAGFHLDELFTRLTFRLWPPRLTPTLRVPRPADAARSATRAA